MWYCLVYIWIVTEICGDVWIVNTSVCGLNEVESCIADALIRLDIGIINLAIGTLLAGISVRAHVGIGSTSETLFGGEDGPVQRSLDDGLVSAALAIRGGTVHTARAAHAQTPVRLAVHLVSTALTTRLVPTYRQSFRVIKTIRTFACARYYILVLGALLT